MKAQEKHCDEPLDLSDNPEEIEGKSNESALDSNLRLGTEVLSMVGNSVKLCMAELQLAAYSAPKALTAWLLSLPALLLCWVSFSALIAWGAYELSSMAILGFLVLFLSQVALLVSIKLVLRHYLSSMSFTQTRGNIESLLKALNDESKTENTQVSEPHSAQ